MKLSLLLFFVLASLPAVVALPRSVSSTISVPGDEIRVLGGETKIALALGSLSGGASKSAALTEILSGMTVALASIPSSIAFANIAGVDPLVGIWSSVILGSVSSLTGLRPGLIAGAAGVVVVPLGEVLKNGKQYMGPTILLAAIMEACFAMAKGGKLINLISEPVMSGFLNGLGCLLLKSQFKVFMSAGEVLPKDQLSATCLVTVVSAGLSLVLPMFLSEAWPTSLFAIIASTLFSQVMNLPVEHLTIGGGGEEPASAFPAWVGLPKLDGEAFGSVLKLIWPAAFSIAVISILETLLAVKVVDDATETKGGETSATMNKSCRALAVGNFASLLFGGFGGCGLIPQTLLNIQSGGSSSISVLAYATVMAVGIVFTSSLIKMVPVASLAGVMILLSLRTIQWKPTIDAFNAVLSGSDTDSDTRSSLIPKKTSNLLALLVSSLLCFFVDMGSGIIAGVLLEKLLPLIVVRV